MAEATLDSVSSQALSIMPLKNRTYYESTVFSEPSTILQVIDEFFPNELSASCEGKEASPEILHVRAAVKMLELQDQIHKVKGEILNLRLMKAAGENYHPHFIEERCKNIGSIVEHLQLIIQNTEVVQHHLRQPTRVDFLPLSFQHHQVFKDATNTIRDLLEKGDEIVANVEWSYAFKDVSNAELLLNSLRSRIMEYHSAATELQMFQHKIVEFCEMHAE